MKLKKSIVLDLPFLLKEKSVDEVAKDLGITRQAVYYWIGKLRSKKIRVDIKKRGIL